MFGWLSVRNRLLIGIYNELAKSLGDSIQINSNYFSFPTEYTIKFKANNYSEKYK